MSRDVESLDLARDHNGLHVSVRSHPGKGNKSDYYTKHHPVAHHRNVRPYYVFDETQPDKYYSPDVNFYAPLEKYIADTDSMTEPETDSDLDESDVETVLTSNCSHSKIMPTLRAGEGVLKSQSRGTRAPDLSLASSATHIGHNIS